jgi:hypothetical protein
MPVPLQPRPTPYGQFQAAGGTSGLGVPLRPAAGKARSNSWSYPASAVAPYAVHPYVASTAGASGIGTGMPAPGPAQPRANRTTTYRQRGGSLSFSSPEEAMRQQYLQQQQAQQQQQGSQMFLPYAAPQPTSQPQPMMAQDSSFLGYGGGGGVGDGGGFLSAYQQQSTQPVAAAQSTPPLPTTPSSFIRRTSLPQTYLHTIPISRSASSGFTPASTDTALPILAQPQVRKPPQSPAHATRHDTTHAHRLMACGVMGWWWCAQTTEVHQKLEIPTHGARALPKEIATHPAIQSITKYIQWAPPAHQPRKIDRRQRPPPPPPLSSHANASAHFSAFLPLHPPKVAVGQPAGHRGSRGGEGGRRGDHGGGR